MDDHLTEEALNKLLPDLQGKMVVNVEFLTILHAEEVLNMEEIQELKEMKCNAERLTKCMNV